MEHETRRRVFWGMGWRELEMEWLCDLQYKCVMVSERACLCCCFLVCVPFILILNLETKDSIFLK